MIQLAKLICLVAGIFFCTITFCQTTGIGDVTSIESKVAAYENNTIKISQYKAELLTLDTIWKGKIQKLKDELAALYKERDNLIADMKVGARCSQCNGWKSEFEKKGVNFAQHLGEVKGYAIPATTSELEATRKSFSDKIAYKKVQIQNLEKGDNAVRKKQNDINNLEKANETLCKEITAHSKSYETKVFSEAKAKHDNWIDDLMGYATNILIADDKITIYKARSLQYQNQFQEEIEKIKARIKKENSDEQKFRTGRIVINVEQIKALQTEQSNYIAPVKMKLNELKQQKEQVDADLNYRPITDSIKAILTANQKQLIEEIIATEKNIRDYNTNVQSKISSIEKENKKMKDEIFQLNANLPKQQAQEIAKRKILYDERIAESNQLAATASTELANAKKAYSEKASHWKRENDRYVNLVISESDRMVVAGKKISCAVWNEARFKVIGNWNQVFPCVNALTTMAKPYGTNVFNAYCPGKSSSSYMASYKSFLLGLSNDDKEAVKGNSNAGWFELITK